MPFQGTQIDKLEGQFELPSALRPIDRCDRCGAAAQVRAVLPTGGELLFCGHHFNEHSARLGQLAAVLHHSRIPSESAAADGPTNY